MPTPLKAILDFFVDKLPTSDGSKNTRNLGFRIWKNELNSYRIRYLGTRLTDISKPSLHQYIWGREKELASERERERPFLALIYIHLCVWPMAAAVVTKVFKKWPFYLVSVANETDNIYEDWMNFLRIDPPTISKLTSC